jgi:hydrogenase-4 component F
MLHAVNHSLIKAMLFLLAGNNLRHYHTTLSREVSGMRRTMPLTALLWTAGFLAVAGSPPFGLFVSELSILQAMLQQERLLTAFAYLACLAAIFVGMSVPVLHMVQDAPPPGLRTSARESLLNTGPSCVLCALVLMLGLYLPGWLTQCLQAAARTLGG